ncbi:MAG: Coenzyme F420-0:L-glutamate ligase @ F420-1:L-glutamate ligase [uncultured Thermomicrobiales bacterium]|uniref:Coenzyme F420-0:L-glutamate ligase @ F420-1:L-glutamate ligase n=1 Tax=uncultured Thermomicrobiales bacterium TaxID=1645740 RepID=A0A6J4VDS8_9BACT|nr:MAG: Coenzyme F420-0:L-glutamate ligase @ F420-1:L-glutamate ligase [uncultured Thermomicrobiales bacterium]
MTGREVAEVRLVGLDGLPEVRRGDDLAAQLGDAIERSGEGLRAGDVVVVTHKVVSKAEGKLVRLSEVTPSAFAERVAAQAGKDARQVEVVLRESVRIVRMDRGVLICETRHGFVCANAGVDASNVAADTVCLLPDDPDRSAAGLREALAGRFGLTGGAAPGVVITDSWGRPWRNGIVNFAIGVAGLAPLVDYRGYHDVAGYELGVTVLAAADELAAASELVMHKLAARPAALIRGWEPPIAATVGTGRDLLIDPRRDLFR